MQEYELNIPELAGTVASCAPSAGHTALVHALQRLPGLGNITLATTHYENGGSWLAKRAVYSATGERVHNDHEAWLRGELAADGGNAATTHRRLRAAGYRLAKTHVVDLHLVADHGGDQANFWQLFVHLQDERLDCELFNAHGLPPANERDLIMEAEGYELPEDQRVRLRPPSYALARAADIGRFLKLADQMDAQEKDRVRERRYLLRSDDGTEETRTHAQMDAGFDRYPCKARRLFDDWAASSAGRSGARLCQHWIMQLSDWTNPKTAERDVSLIPAWTFSKKLAKVQASKGDVYAFYGKLQTLDRRVGVPFGWYFYMLHGNKVGDAAGNRAIEAAEQGLIVMPEHDYRVLRAWRARPYGF